MVDLNGTTPTPAQPAPPPIPPCRILYQQLPNGARVVLGVELGGMVFGGILSVQTGFDLTRPSNENKALVRHVFEVFWPVEWVNAATQSPQLVVAREAPPEPRFPRK